MDKEDESGGSESATTTRSTSQQKSSDKDSSNATSLEDEPAADQVQDIVVNPEQGGVQEWPNITDTLPHSGSSTSGTDATSRASLNALKEIISPKYLPTTVINNGHNKGQIMRHR